MSVSRLPKETIDVLVTGMIEYNVAKLGDDPDADEENESELGTTLLDCNYAAVNEQYNEHGIAMGYHYTLVTPTDREILDAIDEYVFNTADWSEYEDCVAKYYIDTLKDNMLRTYVEREEKRAKEGEK